MKSYLPETPLQRFKVDKFCRLTKYSKAFLRVIETWYRLTYPSFFMRMS